MQSTSIPSYYVGAILKNLDKTGINKHNLLKKHAIPLSLPDNPGARLPAAQFANLQQEVTALLEDEMLGYFESPIPPGTFSMACHSLIHSKSLATAIRRYCDFYALMGRGLVPELNNDGKYAYISLRPTDKHFNYDNYAYEASLYYIHRFLSWLINYHIPLKRVNINYSEPSHAKEYRPLFLGAPFHFNREKSQLVFTNSLLKKSVTQNQQSLALFLKRAVYEMACQDYGSNLWSRKVQQLISHDLIEIPELTDIAQELAIHPQTLRRRLQSEGTSFQGLKNESRRDFAIYRLAKSDQSVEEIARECGYSEPSTFIRAFKGWTGMTPYSYRKK